MKFASHLTSPRPDRSAARRGVMLLEMLIAIGMLAIFLVLAGKLFSTTLRLTHASHTATKDVALFESCVAALRRDAWSAAEMTALPHGGVRIRPGGRAGATIDWSADNDGALVRRTEGTTVPNARRWPGMGTTLTLQPDGAGGLLVRAGDDEVRLVSQVVLAGGRQP